MTTSEQTNTVRDMETKIQLKKRHERNDNKRDRRASITKNVREMTTNEQHTHCERNDNKRTSEIKTWEKRQQTRQTRKQHT